VIEFANKLNLKAMLRWALGRQNWSPFESTPYEFVELNFNFHPTWMRRQFQQAGLTIKNLRTVSHYRINLLKQLLPTWLLVKLDSWAQPTGNWWQLTPSIFVQAQANKTTNTSPSNFFRCPSCGLSTFSPPIPFAQPTADTLIACQSCHQHWSFQNGIYDFKAPINV
jgi:hypothetical protein